MSECILSKVLMYVFHYDYIKNKCRNYYSRLLLNDTDSLMYEIQTEDVYEYFSKDKEMFDFSNYSPKLKYDESNKLVMCSVLLDDSSEHKKTKDVNKTIVATISHGEDRDILLNKKCLRHSMNKIQNKKHEIRTYEINKISLSCFHNKIKNL